MKANLEIKLECTCKNCGCNQDQGEGRLSECKYTGRPIENPGESCLGWKEVKKK